MVIKNILPLSCALCLICCVTLYTTKVLKPAIEHDHELAAPPILTFYLCVF